MLLWRLSGRQHAAVFDGGYGLSFDGRWNTAGHAVTYCATSPSLCLLEKLVHIEDPALLPDLIMVTYDVPDSLAIEIIELADLPSDWRHQEALTHRVAMLGIAHAQPRFRRCRRRSCPWPSAPIAMC